MANSAVTPTAFYTTLGRTDGVAVPAGYVGEFSLSGTSVRNGTGGYTFSNRNNNATTTSFAPYASLTLNKGVYLVSYALTAYQSSGTSDVFTYLAIGGTQVTLTQEGYPGSGGTQSYHNHTQCVPVVITSDNTTVAVYIRTSGSVGTQTSEMYAVRIA